MTGNSKQNKDTNKETPLQKVPQENENKFSISSIKEGLKDLKNKGKDIATKLTEKGIEENLADLKNEVAISQLSIINEHYRNENEKLTEETKEADIKKISESSVEDVRFKTRLLVEKKENESPEEEVKNIKAETNRRIKAYTDEEKGGWFTLNYEKYGYDHEMNIGLGDILLDPSIQEVAIIKDGQNHIIKRGFVNNRPCFTYEDGSYVATFTGDKFRILSNEEISDHKKFLELYNKEEESRKLDKEDFRSYTEYTSNNHFDVATAVANYNGNYSTDEYIIKQINKERKEKDGEKVLEHAKKCAQNFNIPWEIYRELVNAESTWKPGAAYKGEKNSNATGLGQFIGSTWESFKKAYNAGRTKNPKLIAGQSLERTNPYAMAYATAWLMAETKKGFPNLDSKPLYEQSIIYYFTHHEGTVGKTKAFLKLLDEMQKNGAHTKNQMAQEYQANQEKYNKILKPGQVSRVKSYGINDFLKIYFSVAKDGVAVRASATNEEAKKLANEQKLQEGFNNENVTYSKESPRNSVATDSKPYMFYQGHDKYANGGAPGFKGGNGTNYKLERAMSQFRNMYKQGFRTIVSLAEAKHSAQAIQALKREGIHLKHIVPQTVSNTDKKRNISIAKHIINNEAQGKTYIHCRHGAHRAPSITTEILRLKGEIKSKQDMHKKVGFEDFRFRSDRAKSLRRITIEN